MSSINDKILSKKKLQYTHYEQTNKRVRVLFCGKIQFFSQKIEQAKQPINKSDQSSVVIVPKLATVFTDF